MVYKAKNLQNVNVLYFGPRNIGWQLKLLMTNSEVKNIKTEFGSNIFLLEIAPVTTYVHKVYTPYKS